jgi:hypothetical protein
MPPALLDFRQAQSYLGNVSRSFLKALRARGDVVAVRIGERRVMFTIDGLDAYIARRIKTSKARQRQK